MQSTRAPTRIHGAPVRTARVRLASRDNRARPRADRPGTRGRNGAPVGARGSILAVERGPDRDEPGLRPRQRRGRAPPAAEPPRVAAPRPGRAVRPQHGCRAVRGAALPPRVRRTSPGRARGRPAVDLGSRSRAARARGARAARRTPALAALALGLAARDRPGRHVYGGRLRDRHRGRPRRQPRGRRRRRPHGDRPSDRGGRRLDRRLCRVLLPAAVGPPGVADRSAVRLSTRERRAAPAAEVAPERRRDLRHLRDRQRDRLDEPVGRLAGRGHDRQPGRDRPAPEHRRRDPQVPPVRDRPVDQPDRLLRDRDRAPGRCLRHGGDALDRTCCRSPPPSASQRRPWPLPRCSIPCGGGCSTRSTAASTAPVTTPRRRSPTSRSVCSTRSTSTPCEASFCGRSANRSSLRGCRSGRCRRAQARASDIVGGTTCSGPEPKTRGER